MIEIERHIQKLLLTADCVIVPGFGGFIAHHVPARYDDARRAFYPPLRTLGFNPQLTMNDSLLAQSFVETYDISFPEATVRIEENVARLEEAIATRGRYDMEGLGTMTMTEDGVYNFVPCKNGILTPGFYGLAEFEMARLPQSLQTAPVALPVEPEEQAEEQVLPTAEAPVIEAEENLNEETELAEEERKYFRIPKVALYRLAVACVAFIAILLIPTPVGNSSQLSLSSGGIDTNLLYRILPKDTTTPLPHVDKNGSVLAKDSTGVKTLAERTDSASIASGEPSTCFCIVMASRVSLKNAKAYVEQLQHKGFETARVCTQGRYTKVVYGQFETMAEASQALNKLNDNIDFKDCWITELSLQ